LIGRPGGRVRPNQHQKAQAKAVAAE